MKRFTQTEKWRDPWFRKLSPIAKLLWFYLCDNCDNAGVVDLDMELASFSIGEVVNQNHIREFGDRVHPIGHKFWLPKFVHFQFGDLTQGSVIHRSVLRLIETHNLSQYNTNPSHDHGINIPLDKEKDKDKETVKEKDKAKPVNGNGLSPTSFQFQERICKLYKRESKTFSNCDEQYSLVELIKRPEIMSELAELERFKPRYEYFPRSVRSLLERWDATLDASRNQPKQQKSQLEREIERL